MTERSSDLETLPFQLRSIQRATNTWIYLHSEEFKVHLLWICPPNRSEGDQRTTRTTATPLGVFNNWVWGQCTALNHTSFYTFIIPKSAPTAFQLDNDLVDRNKASHMGCPLWVLYRSFLALIVMHPRAKLDGAAWAILGVDVWEHWEMKTSIHNKLRRHFLKLLHRVSALIECLSDISHPNKTGVVFSRCLNREQRRPADEKAAAMYR